MRINSSLLELYWSIGADIVDKQAESKWGGGVIEQLSKDLRSEFPEQQGFSVTNLRYMKRFYLLWQNATNLVANYGTKDLFIDLLFYQVDLHCYVVVELKAQEFEASFTGQLGAYVSAVNHHMKKGIDNPTIGLLICKSKNDVYAEYSLESSSQPIGISAYELSNLLPEEFKSTLPSIEEIEATLKDEPNN